MKKTIGLTYIYAIIAVILWGFSFIWSNDLINLNIPIFTFIFIRLSLAGIVLLFISRLSGKLQNIEKSDYKWFLLMAFSEPFIYFIGESFGLKATASPTIAAIIIATIPIFCLIYERFISNVKMSTICVLGILITIPGILMVVLDGGFATPEHLYGIFLLFVAVAGAVSFSIVTKKLANKYNNFTITTYQFLIGALLFLPFFIFLGAKGVNANLFTFKVLYPLLMLSLLCSCLCFVLWVGVIRDLGITRTNIFSALVPAFSILGVALLGAEQISPIKIAGIGIAIIGVILAQRK